MTPHRPPTDPVQASYDRLAAVYDERWSYYIRRTTEETAKRLCIVPGQRVLDLGCGSAAMMATIRDACPMARITGLDLSRNMLAVARERLGRKGSLVKGRAQELPFRDRSFDLVVSCNAFHYWRAPKECLREIERVLRPGGRVIVTDWCDDYLACKFCDVFLRFFDKAHFKTYGRKECERLLTDTGFAGVELERYRINWLWGLMTAQAIRATATGGRIGTADFQRP